MTSVNDIIPQARSQRPEARTDPRLDWFREAKFGMFIHWGLYALPAGEWQGRKIPGIGEWIMHRAQIPVAEYEQLAAQFNPVRFDAAEWVRLAKEAGQKYMVITAKHHDGFCLFKSAVTDYNTVDATPFGRDVVQELAEECGRQGLKFGVYYSQTQDWHHPDGDGNFWDYDEEQQDFDGYIEHYVKAQVRELLTNYGPLCLIWFDTPKGLSEAHSRELLDLVHTLQPDCLVSGRLGNALGDYAEAGDNKIPDVAVDADWETPATINDTWGFKGYDHRWKSNDDLVVKLVDIVSKGGNYLLNVGPTAEGVIPKPSVGRLLGMGGWLDVNGESVYGTQPGPIQGLGWCRSTMRGATVYLHVLRWPEDGALRVPLTGVQRAYLLGDPYRDPLDVIVSGDETVLLGPIAPAPSAVAAPDTVVVLER
jgi:alpha-L-fucosidase